MNTLADFKRKLRGLVELNRRHPDPSPAEWLKITVYGPDGLIYHDKPPAPIWGVRAHDFAVWRMSGRSFLDFGKAVEWSFTDTVATRVEASGRKVTVEFVPAPVETTAKGE